MAAADLPTSTHKMAVKAVDSQPSGNQPMKAEVTSNDFEPRSAPIKSVGDLPKKRTTFKILGVTKNAPRSGSNDPLNDDGDSLDDLDESHTEEISSDILDSSKNTDGDQDTPSEDTTHNLTPDEIVVKEKTDIHSRFKVVKIETKEPFRRGRWICYDFLDTPANNNADRNEIRFLVDSASGNSSTTSSVNFIFGVDDPSKNPFLTHLLPSVDGSGGPAPPVSVVTVVPTLPSCGIHLPTNSETFKPIQPPSQPSQNSGQTMRTEGVSVGGGSGIPTIVPLGAKIAGTTIHTNPISLPTSNALQAQSHMSQGHQTTPMSSSKTPVNPTANLVTSNAPAISGPLPGTTVSNVLQGAQQSPSNPILRESSNLSAPQPSKVLPSPVTRANPAQSVAPIIHVSNVTNPSDAHGSASSVASISSIPMTVQSTQQMHMAGAAGSQATTAHPQCPLAVNSHMPPGAVTPVMTHQSLDSKSEKSGPVLGHDVVKTSGEHVNVRPENIQLNEVLDNDRLFDTSMQAAASLSLTPLTSAVSEMGTPAKEGKEDSGSSTVAIDNKIEQAMDLVKSHLMFAVREEVEVLKEQIKELTEKNNQLEYENTILRTSASPDTLSKLSQPRPQPPPATTS